MPRSTLFSLDYAGCELRKALIYNGLVCVSKTPKAVLECYMRTVNSAAWRARAIRHPIQRRAGAGPRMPRVPRMNRAVPGMCQVV
ncbi:hypothetical protein DP46_6046 [Burkholderia phage BEK]|uniref:Uncharacterized protein n=1 Tax=Burkholderia phage BEK TaxID=1514988 RepID=A0A4P1QFM1_9CAUD|nr:hypothetical protein DP46_6046 [Burkholderia phage BEK]